VSHFSKAKQVIINILQQQASILSKKKVLKLVILLLLWQVWQTQP
jgi:hypothetical protein